MDSILWLALLVAIEIAVLIVFAVRKKKRKK
jgi:hypothetical protein